jgi:hypothetical protein
MSPRTKFGIVGGGWRSHFLLRLADAAPGRLNVAGVVTRTADAGERVTARWAVPTYRTIDELLKAVDVDYVVAAVSWPAMPGVIRDLVAAGVAVLAETPGTRPRAHAFPLAGRCGIRSRPGCRAVLVDAGSCCPAHGHPGRGDRTGDIGGDLLHPPLPRRLVDPRTAWRRHGRRRGQRPRLPCAFGGSAHLRQVGPASRPGVADDCKATLWMTTWTPKGVTVGDDG